MLRVDVTSEIAQILSLQINLPGYISKQADNPEVLEPMLIPPVVFMSMVPLVALEESKTIRILPVPSLQ